MTTSGSGTGTPVTAPAETPRLTTGDLRGIIETDLTDSELNGFIITAHLLVNSKLTGLSESLLGEIEKYLAAHFTAIARERRAESESVAGEWQTRYEGKTETGLKATLYGQTALALDTSGKLATLGKQSPQFRVFKATHGEITA